MSLRALRAACGGFLLAVLWFDLMFDVQVLGHGAAPAPLPDETLASIARYYARVTGGAHPMQVLVALVMATAVLASLWNVRRSPQAARAWIMLLLVAAPVGPRRLAGGSERHAARDAQRFHRGAEQARSQYLRRSRLLLARDRGLHDPAGHAKVISRTSGPRAAAPR
jgi:hypothetical protein